MAEGDDNGDRGLAPLPPGMKRYSVRSKKNPKDDPVVVVGPIGADQTPEGQQRIFQKAAEEFARRTSTPAAVDIPGALVHGVARGVAGQLSPLGQAAQVEMGQVGPGFAPVPSTKETTQILESQLPAAVPHHEARTPAGQVAERFGEFVADPASWIGPGGFFRKGLSTLTGAIGSVAGEKYLGGAAGSIIGGVAGGGVGGVGGGGKGLPSRVPREIREKTTEEALRGASKEAYQQLREFDKYVMPVDQAWTLKRTMEQELVQGERQFRPNGIPKVWARLQELVKPYGRPNAGVTVGDIERVRQGLNTERMGGGAEALAASDAIAVIDEYMVNLPGVAGVTEAARKNWAAYKRGQIVEEAIRRGAERAATTGKGANTDNAIRQEFRKLSEKKFYETTFTAAEKEQIQLIMEPGRSLNFARWLSAFSPQHIITAAAGLFGVGHFTGDPLQQLALLTGGAIAQKYATRMTSGRANRLLEATRARAPASGYPGPDYFTPKVAPPPAARGGYGAARALGATTLSPSTTDALELPEIVVRPQQQ